jgi:hypothetical protein
MAKKTPKRWEVTVAHLLTEPTAQQAADKAKVPYRTLKSWLADPRFQRLFREARRQVVEHAIGQVQMTAGEAKETLKRLLTCGHPPTEKGAAVALLELSLKGVEVADLAQEVEELKAQLAGAQDGAGGTAAAGQEAEGRGGEAAGEGDPP